MAHEPSTEYVDESSAEQGPFRRWVQGAISNPQKVYRAMFYSATLMFLLTTLFPFYWLLVLALTPQDALTNMGLVPNGFNPGAFVTIFERLPFHLYVFNSFVLALTTTVIVLLLASLAGYVFGRIEFTGRAPLMLLILAVSYFPPAAFLLPLFDLFTGNVEVLGVSSPMLFNTPGAMIMPFSALYMPLAIFILTTFYGQIPDGLEDAARIEGSTRIGALFKIIVPLSAPGVATAGVLTFIIVYNEFFFSFLMLEGNAEEWGVLLHGILRYQGTRSQAHNLMAAASLVGVIPMAALVALAQDKIVSGLTQGALKE